MLAARCRYGVIGLAAILQIIVAIPAAVAIPPAAVTQAADSVTAWPLQAQDFGLARADAESFRNQSLENDGTWTQFELDRFTRRAGHVSIYDPLRDRFVVFGGYDRSNIPFDETWALSLSDPPTWSRLVASGPKPPARNFHSGIYDPLRNRIVIFGGYDGTHRNDVWSFSLSDDSGWTPVVPAGTPPAGRWGHVAVYDPLRDRMVIMGGHLGNQVDANDVWALSLSGTPTWTALSPTGVLPAPRNLHAGAYDALRDRLIIFGGETNWTSRDDLWALDFSSGPMWTELTPQGALPTARHGHVMVHHPNADKLVIYGGQYVSETYELSLEGTPVWSVLTPSGDIPTGRYAASGAIDLLRDRLVIIGGDEGPQRSAGVSALELDETPSWAEIEPLPFWPVGRWGHAMVLDPSRNRFLVIGGSLDAEVGVTDVWEYALDSEMPWKRITPTGVPPSGLREHSAIYDPGRDRVIVFGGYDQDYRNETWSLSLTGTPRWTQLTMTGTLPPRRSGHVAVYHAGRKSMLVFGGYNGTFLSDVWSLELSGTPTWKLLVPSGLQPAGRMGAAGIVDTAHDRLIIFGGFGGDDLFNDVWSLGGTGSSWVQLMPSGAAPSPRLGHSAVLDEAAGRMVVFGGFNSWFPGTNDVWALTLEGPAAWSELLPAGTKPPERSYHSAGQDPFGNRMMIFGGDNDGQNDDVWFLTWTADRSALVGVPRPTELRVTDSDLVVFPNPASGPIEILYRVTSERAFDLAVYDVSGRKIRSLSSGGVLVGVQSARWDRLDSSGRRVAPGTYFLRLTSSSGQSASHRITLVR